MGTGASRRTGCAFLKLGRPWFESIFEDWFKRWIGDRFSVDCEARNVVLGFPCSCDLGQDLSKQTGKPESHSQIADWSAIDARLAGCVCVLRYDWSVCGKINKTGQRKIGQFDARLAGV